MILLWIVFSWQSKECTVNKSSSNNCNHGLICFFKPSHKLCWLAAPNLKLGMIDMNVMLITEIINPDLLTWLFLSLSQAPSCQSCQGGCWGPEVFTSMFLLIWSELQQLVNFDSFFHVSHCQRFVMWAVTPSVPTQDELWPLLPVTKTWLFFVFRCHLQVSLDPLFHLRRLLSMSRCQTWQESSL